MPAFTSSICFSSCDGVFRLDDARHGAVAVAHDAAVHRRIVELHRQQRQRVPRALVLIEQALAAFRDA